MSCTVCIGGISNCTLLPCNHTICGSCMTEIIKDRSVNKCSVCNTDIERITFNGDNELFEETKLPENGELSYSNKLNPLLFYFMDSFPKMSKGNKNLVLLFIATYVTFYLIHSILVFIEYPNNITQHYWLIIGVPAVLLLFDFLKIIYGIIPVNISEFSIIQNVPKVERIRRHMINACIGASYVFSIFFSFLFIILSLFKLSSGNSHLIIFVVLINVCNAAKEFILIYECFMWENQYNSIQMIDDAV